MNCPQCASPVGSSGDLSCLHRVGKYEVRYWLIETLAGSTAVYDYHTSRTELLFFAAKHVILDSEEKIERLMLLK